MVKKFINRYLNGHISIGNLTMYSNNSMKWAINYYTKKWGYVCFRPISRSNGRWNPPYFYVSPNATPWAATFMIGKKANIEDWSLSRVRRYRLGHNFDTESDSNSEILDKINRIL